MIRVISFLLELFALFLLLYGYVRKSRNVMFLGGMLLLLGGPLHAFIRGFLLDLFRH